MKELCISLDDELYKYLSLLERFKLIQCKEEAVIAAIRIFKKLNMQDWLPYIYRVGTERVFIVGQRLLHDIFNAMSETQLYDVARVSALKRRILKPFDPELDLLEALNWDVILNELEDFGWGKFTRKGDEIMVEFLGVPIIFLKGYLETLFQVEFRTQKTKMADVYILSKVKNKTEIWR